MGQWRKGTVTKGKRKQGWTDPMTIPRANQVMGGGGRVFTPAGKGKSKFLTAGSKVYPTKVAKIGSGVAGTGAVAASVGLYEKKQTPSGAATTGAKAVGTRQMSAVTALRSSAKSSPPISKVPKWHGDIASFAKSGYHTFKAGSKSAKAFQQSYRLAKKTGAKNFTWGLTGKKYKVGY
jgi:hypothetical protein